MIEFSCQCEPVSSIDSALPEALLGGAWRDLCNLTADAGHTVH